MRLLKITEITEETYIDIERETARDGEIARYTEAESMLDIGNLIYRSTAHGLQIQGETQYTGPTTPV